MTKAERHARHILSWLYQQHHIHHHPTLLDDGLRSYTHFPDWLPQIVLSRASVRKAFKTGYEEYPALQYLLEGREVVGWAGVRQLCLHEFAHVLQYRARCPRRNLHDVCFIRHYQTLMSLPLPH